MKLALNNMMSNIMYMASAANVNNSGLSYEGWMAIRIVTLSLIALCSLFLVIVVMLQPTEAQGLGSISGESDTFFEQNKGKTRAARLKKATVIVVSVLVALCIFFFTTYAMYDDGTTTTGIVSIIS